MSDGDEKSCNKEHDLDVALTAIVNMTNGVEKSCNKQDDLDVELTASVNMTNGDEKSFNKEDDFDVELTPSVNMTNGDEKSCNKQDDLDVELTAIVNMTNGDEKSFNKEDDLDVELTPSLNMTNGDEKSCKEEDDVDVEHTVSVNMTNGDEKSCKKEDDVNVEHTASVNMTNGDEKSCKKEDDVDVEHTASVNMTNSDKKSCVKVEDLDVDPTGPLDNSDSNSEHEKPKRKVCKFNYAEPVPEQIASDDEEKFLKPMATTAVDDKPESRDGTGLEVAHWRYGPAQLWYDMLSVPENGEGFDYGIKMTNENKKNIRSSEEPKKAGDEFPDDAFLMVTQIHWEDDVVWDGNDIKHKVLQTLNSTTNAAGWVPSKNRTTMQTGNSELRSSGNSFVWNGNKNTKQTKRNSDQDNTIWYSILPVENEDLVHGKWEDNVIWDAENIENIPKPSILTFDPNDENIIMAIPDDIPDPSKTTAGQKISVKAKISLPHLKKSKILLGKAGVINVPQEDLPPSPPQSPNRDPFNISNDKYYQPQRQLIVSCSKIQHSTPVVEFKPPFIQTHMGVTRLRNFHRPPMKRFSRGLLADPGPHRVKSLIKPIKKKAEQRESERMASGGGDVFFMRSPGDLTGRDGEIVLVEFCEEHPPLINQVGMCSRIKNYYKRTAKDSETPPLKYGEPAYYQSSPFLGSLRPGEWLQCVENNMYRAPIYSHDVPQTDFLIIRTRQQYYIREIDHVYVAGQECPLHEVPGPNSKMAGNFIRDFLQVFIYRLFWKSRDNPRRIKMEDIKKAFPSHSESSIRKRLKPCANFIRTGMHSNWWVIKPEFRLPTEEELRALVSPEQYCAYFSMIAAQQRLKDAGYGEKSIFQPSEDDDEEIQLKMDDEVKVAPWNTTKAYIQAVRGKCLLQVTGPADPTGCGEGFSYVRVPNKPMPNTEKREPRLKRTLIGTAADLRRLPLGKAKDLLRKFDVPEKAIKKMTRWELVDAVRTLSTEKAREGEEGMDMFSRGNRFSIAEHQERYKKECQRLFDLQNRILGSSEMLSTDEGESSDEESDEDIEEMGKNIENMLANKKTSSRLSLEREQERQKLKKFIMEGDNRKGGDKKKDKNQDAASCAEQGRVLKITRTFEDDKGKKFTKVEIVRNAAVIDAYEKIRNTKNEEFIRQFAKLDEAQIEEREEMKREKRRLQEKLRRIQRNQEKERLALGTTSRSSTHGGNPGPSKPTVVTPPKSRSETKLKSDLKSKCTACGHRRHKASCPLYQNTSSSAPMDVAMTEEQDEESVRLERIKARISRKYIKQDEEIKRTKLLRELPRESAYEKRKRKRRERLCNEDYSWQPPKKMRKEEIIEKDFQVSSEEEPDAVPTNEIEDNKGELLLSARMPMEVNADDDSQQTAEDMVQLGSGYYHHPKDGDGTDTPVYKDESLDVDPNYDPSDFPMSGLPMHSKTEETMIEDAVQSQESSINIHDDLAVSDSEDEMMDMSPDAPIQKGTEIFVEESLDVDPNYDPSDFLMSGLPMHSKTKETMIEDAVQSQESSINIHDDRAVSDSEDEMADMSPGSPIRGELGYICFGEDMQSEESSINIHDDLAVSESEDEVANMSPEPPIEEERDRDESYLCF